MSSDIVTFVLGFEPGAGISLMEMYERESIPKTRQKVSVQEV